MSLWIQVGIPVLCALISAAVTFYVQYRKEKQRKAEIRAKEMAHLQKEKQQKKRIDELELTQGELSDCVARYMRDNPDSEIFHRIRTNDRVTRVTNIEKAVLYVKKQRQERGIKTKRIPIYDPEKDTEEDEE